MNIKVCQKCPRCGVNKDISLAYNNHLRKDSISVWRLISSGGCYYIQIFCCKYINVTNDMPLDNGKSSSNEEKIKKELCAGNYIFPKDFHKIELNDKSCPFLLEHSVCDLNDGEHY